MVSLFVRGLRAQCSTRARSQGFHTALDPGHTGDDFCFVSHWKNCTGRVQLLGLFPAAAVSQRLELLCHGHLIQNNTFGSGEGEWFLGDMVCTFFCTILCIIIVFLFCLLRSDCSVRIISPLYGPSRALSHAILWWSSRSLAGEMEMPHRAANVSEEIDDATKRAPLESDYGSGKYQSENGQSVLRYFCEEHTQHIQTKGASVQNGGDPL